MEIEQKSDTEIIKEKLSELHRKRSLLLETFVDTVGYYHNTSLSIYKNIWNSGNKVNRALGNKDRLDKKFKSFSALISSYKDQCCQLQRQITELESQLDRLQSNSVDCEE